MALVSTPAPAQQPGSAAYNSVYLPAHGVGDTRQRHVPEQWGAFATGKGGVIAWVMEGETRESAERAAMDECISTGTDDCSVEATFMNECVVLVANQDIYAWSSGSDSMRSLRRTAMRKCGTTDCQVIREGCTLPVR